MALAQSRHDAIGAQAALLAAIGDLEARVLLNDETGYDAQANLRMVRKAGAVPWEGIVRRLDVAGETESRRCLQAGQPEQPGVAHVEL